MKIPFVLVCVLVRLMVDTGLLPYCQLLLFLPLAKEEKQKGLAKHHLW